MKRKTIDFDTLTKLDACFSQRYLWCDFVSGPDKETEWGYNKRVAITPENVIKADNEGLDVEWLVTRVLKDEDYRLYIAELQAAKRKHHGRTSAGYIKARAKITAKYLSTKWNPVID